MPLHGMRWKRIGMALAKLGLLYGSWLLHATLMNVKNMVNMFASSVWDMRCTALLCMAILSHLIHWLVHVDRRCGHVLLSHNFGIVCG